MGTVTVNLALCKVKYTVKMLSIGLVLAIGSLTGTLACENTTLPDGTTCPPTGNHLYVDPDHCSRYWECYNGCLNHITCQNDYLFDPVHGWCDFPQNVCCGERDCDGRSCNDECGEGDDFDCPKPSGFFEDPKNCMKYWQCNNDIAQHHSCDTQNGQQLLFRLSDVQCDWSDRVDCGDRPICDIHDENCIPQPEHTTKPHQFAKEFLAIMETDSTQKVVVHNVFADVLEDFIMKHVAHLGYFSTLLSTNAIGLVTSMVANKLFK